MLAITLVASCAVLVGSFAVARADTSCRRMRSTAQPSKRRRTAIGMWDLELLSMLAPQGHRTWKLFVIPHDTNASFRGIDLYNILERKCGSRP
jgi:hypothetical protein